MGFWDKITGAEVSQKVDEYTDTIGTVLLGVRADVQAQQRQIASLQQQSAEHAQRIAQHSRHLQEQGERLRQVEAELRSAVSRWQQVLGSEIRQHMVRTQGELQTLVKQHLQQARREASRYIQEEILKHVQRQEAVIRSLRKQCAFAYLFAIAVGVLVWMLK